MSVKIIVIPVLWFLAFTHIATAQQPKIFRVGVLLPGGAQYETLDGLRQGLREAGLEEGKQVNLMIRDIKGERRPPPSTPPTLLKRKRSISFTRLRRRSS